MKLVDKMIALSSVIKNNSESLLTNDNLLEKQEFFEKQSLLWKDKSNHESIINILQEMQELADQYNKQISHVNEEASKLLRKQENEIRQKDYYNYQEVVDIQIIQERIDSYTPAAINELSLQIGRYSSWQYAGVELNPSTGKLTNKFLACDPLYIYQGHATNPEKVRSQFNSFFGKKRMFFYKNIDDLPNGQLGLAVNIGTYEFMPTDPIKKEMKEIINALAPGGHFLFTYNDCEQIASLDLCVDTYRCYNTKQLMSTLAYSIGFDVVASGSTDNGTHSWMVVKKPGNLTTQKLSAPLVSIDKNI